MLIIQLTCAALMIASAAICAVTTKRHMKRIIAQDKATTLPAWLARDKDGSLWLFMDKPCKSIGGVMGIPSDDCECIRIDSSLFPNITFENSPEEIMITLRETPTTL